MTTLAQQIGRINANLETTAKAREFCDLARIIALSRGDHAVARQLAHEKRNLNRRGAE